MKAHQKKGQKNMIKPIVSKLNKAIFAQILLFKLYQTKTRVQIWLYDQPETRFEGKIIGFDEYMNLVVDQCEEINLKKEIRNYLGRIMLKGDNLSLVRSLDT